MSVKPESVGMCSARLARIDRFLAERYIDSGRMPCAQLQVMRDGRLVHQSVLGQASLEDGRPLADDTIVRIYSMTKPITSVAFMMLVEQGLVALDDPVHRYIPSWRNLGVYVGGGGGLPGTPPGWLTRPTEAPMRIIDLLRHTSGLTYQPFGRSAVKDEYAKVDMTPASRQLPCDLTKMARRIGTLPLAYVPGTTWDYSISTDLLGLVVERASGMKLDAYLQQRILGPLGMKDTAFWVPPDKQARLAEAYPVDPDSKAKVELLDVRRPPVLLAGGGGMVSTADDYLRFVQMLLNGGELDGTRIVSRKTVEYMASDHLGAIGRGPAYLPGPGHGFGLGFAVRTATGESSWYGSVGDYYWGGYAGTAFWVDPKERLVAVWMMQGPGQSGQYRPLLRAAVYTALDR